MSSVKQGQVQVTDWTAQAQKCWIWLYYHQKCRLMRTFIIGLTTEIGREKSQVSDWVVIPSIIAISEYHRVG